MSWESALVEKSDSKENQNKKIQIIILGKSRDPAASHWIQSPNCIPSFRLPFIIMARSSSNTYLLIILGIFAFCLTNNGVYAFGAGNIPS
jgi:hypothetical protein